MPSRNNTRNEIILLTSEVVHSVAKKMKVVGFACVSSPDGNYLIYSSWSDCSEYKQSHVCCVLSCVFLFVFSAYIGLMVQPIK